MSPVRGALVGFAAAGIAALIGSASAQMKPDPRLGFGAPASQTELSGFFAIAPDGAGLPSGSGTAQQGAEVYARNCVPCHGEKLEGNPAKGIGGDKLIGGRGTLASGNPVKTVESYWPYATTLFDYVKRAMPFSAPGSLSDDEVYAVVAYILSEAKIIPPSEAMTAETLPKVHMPNRDGFVGDPRPEPQLYR